MDARITREETALLLNIDSPKESEVETLRLQALQTREAAFNARLLGALESVVGGLRAAFAAIRAYPERMRTLRHLNALTDRELADIGLARGELGRVFDADYATDRTAAAMRPAHLAASSI